MNPIELRILNSYRDGDMKAHRREAKNCALVECCQVVAEKAGVRLSAEALAATSLTGGGGERGRLPKFTATDQNGRVEGFDTGSYARKTSSGETRKPQPARTPQAPTPSAVTQQPPARPAPSATAPAQPSAPPTPPPPASPSRPVTSRPGAMRFSSLSGFRRR